MSKQKLRIVTAGLIAISALTALLIVLPFTALTLTAYLFLVADIVLFLATFWQIADSGIERYLTNAAFVLALRPWVLLSAAVSVVFPALEHVSIYVIPVVWFCVIQIVVFAIAGIIMLVIGAGQEEIERLQAKRAHTTSAWKKLRCDIEAVLAKTPTGLKRQVSSVRDAIRYASPVSYPALASLEHAIRSDVSALGVLIDGGYEGVETLCGKICDEVKDRANRLKLNSHSDSCGATAADNTCGEIGLEEIRRRNLRDRNRAFLLIAALFAGVLGLYLYVNSEEKAKRERIGVERELNEAGHRADMARAEAKRQATMAIEEADRQAEMARADAERQAEVTRVEAEYSARREVAVDELLSNMVAIPGKRFKMCRYEVTQALWESVMGENPSGNVGQDFPVERVSWNDCQTFISKLNAHPKVVAAVLAFRLPTESEWDYSCRANGNMGTGELGDRCWCLENSGGRTHPVGGKRPNGFGLYDMLGNVWEWTSSGTNGRLACGGSRDDEARDCTPSARIYLNPSESDHEDCGLRLVADPGNAASPAVSQHKDAPEVANVDPAVAAMQKKYYVNSKWKDGTYIGSFGKETVLVLQYLSGKWTSDARKRNYVSPDDEQARSEDMLALIEVKTGRRYVVPGETRLRPFVLVLPQDGDYRLMINAISTEDASDVFRDNDGFVKYGVVSLMGEKARDFLRSTSTGQYQGDALTARGGSLRIKTQMSGRGFLCIGSREVWFVCEGLEVPEKTGGEDHATYVNGAKWRPQWSMSSGKVCSDKYSVNADLPPLSGAKAWLRVSSAQGRVEIVEQPSQENEFTLKLCLGGHAKGAALYDFTVYW